MNVYVIIEKYGYPEMVFLSKKEAKAFVEKYNTILGINKYWIEEWTVGNILGDYWTVCFNRREEIISIQNEDEKEPSVKGILLTSVNDLLPRYMYVFGIYGETREEIIANARELYNKALFLNEINWNREEEQEWTIIK